MSRVFAVSAVSAAVSGVALLGAAVAWRQRRRRLAEIAEVLGFWFEGETSSLYASRWFVQPGSAALSQLDELVRVRFGELLRRGERGEIDHWARDSRGALALVLLLDQFSRHVHRGDAEAIRTSDERALAHAQTLLTRGWHRELSAAELVFALMPLRHSPSVEGLEQVDDGLSRCLAICSARPRGSRPVAAARAAHALRTLGRARPSPAPQVLAHTGAALSTSEGEAVVLARFRRATSLRLQHLQGDGDPDDILEKSDAEARLDQARPPRHSLVPRSPQRVGSRVATAASPRTGRSPRSGSRERPRWWK